MPETALLAVRLPDIRMANAKFQSEMALLITFVHDATLPWNVNLWPIATVVDNTWAGKITRKPRLSIPATAKMYIPETAHTDGNKTPPMYSF